VLVLFLIRSRDFVASAARSASPAHGERREVPAGQSADAVEGGATYMRKTP